MTLTVLNVAYPLAPVAPDCAGGAEQVLALLDRALVASGGRSIVVACEGSRVAGMLRTIPVTRGCLDDAARDTARAEHRAGIADVLARWPVDVVHLHGIDALHYLPAPGVPALITLHLPPAWYPGTLWNTTRPDTWLNCVSHTQRLACPVSDALLPTIPNGVELPEVPVARKGYTLALGRICPEKGFHLAIEAACRADVPLLLAGQIFAYESHERYWREEVLPRLDERRRFVGAVGGVRKARLLAGARCLLVPSLAPETSSLVAMEAMMCGTPVIAFPAGALAEIVEHGVTGFLVHDAHQMADAIAKVHTIDADTCRTVARERYSATLMTRRYLTLYQTLASRDPRRALH